MRKLFLIPFVLSSVLLSSIDSSLIIQPCGWDYGEDRNVVDKINDTIEYCNSNIILTGNGFSVEKKEFSYTLKDESHYLHSEEITIVIDINSTVFDESMNTYDFECPSSSNYLLFILSNNLVQNSIRKNEIGFFLNGGHKIAFAPRRLGVSRSPDGKAEGVFLNDDNFLIRFLGPIDFFDIDINEYEIGDIIGTFQQSLQLKFYSLESRSDIIFTPISIYDNRIIPYDP